MLCRHNQYKIQFDEGDTTLTPLVVYGDGLKNSDHVHYCDLRVGKSGINIRTSEKKVEARRSVVAGH